MKKKKVQCLSQVSKVAAVCQCKQATCEAREIGQTIYQDPLVTDQTVSLYCHPPCSQCKKYTWIGEEGLLPGHLCSIET